MGRGWEAWRQHLAQRSLRPIGKLLGASRSPLIWSQPDGADVATAITLANQLHPLWGRSRRVPKKLEQTTAGWLAGAVTAPRTASLGIECLAWCWASMPLAGHLEERLWWDLLNHLIAIAQSREAIPDDPVAWQLLSGELPLALAYWFPEIAKCRALADPARGTITEGFEKYLDGRGMPLCTSRPLLRPLLACWTRCRALGDELDDGWCARSAGRQYQNLVQNALRLSRASGQPVFSAADAAAWNPEFIKTAIRLAGGETRKLWRLTTEGSASPRVSKTMPSPARESEQAGVALLRSDWRRSSPRLAVRYSAWQTALELNVGAKCLLSGTWSLDVRANGERLLPLGDWEQNAWILDDDVHYLELDVRLSTEVTVERHMLLARKHGVLLLADAVLGIQDARIEYRGSLALGGFSRFQGEAETREGTLAVGGKPAARVLPLALPEWRAERFRGDLEERDGALELTQTVDGQCLFAPLLFDLDASRLRRETTWRQLTVAEDRQIVPGDVAVGYRAQAGASQWLVYRSLAAPSVRSLLGKNLMHQFLMGNVLSTGRIETLIEVDST